MHVILQSSIGSRFALRENRSKAQAGWAEIRGGPKAGGPELPAFRFGWELSEIPGNVAIRHGVGGGDD
ncbi:hypothetical protein WG901_08575 [Novosphingobium sp. PS1R-30]|uniref:Uncharacterized protein n=1 Tax=Novosphingobium anseongense TaxID=3133436 RepID=A0ABU8RVF4_9SPHN